jgi:hypothetical protein
MTLSFVAIALLASSLVNAVPMGKTVRAYGFNSWDEVKARGLPALNEETAKIYKRTSKRDASSCSPLSKESLNGLPDLVKDVQVRCLCLLEDRRSSTDSDG